VLFLCLAYWPYLAVVKHINKLIELLLLLLLLLSRGLHNLLSVVSQIKENARDWTYKYNKINKKCIHNCDWETFWKEVTWNKEKEM
jgi:hypothetical protein